MVDIFKIARYLLLLAAGTLIWGCAATPLSSNPSDSGKSKQAELKVKKKRTKVKRKKSRVATRPERSAETAAEKLAEEASDQELVVGHTMFHYDYYPDSEVYFDTIRHLYFYRDEGVWTMSVALPTLFQKKLGDSIRLKMISDQPYLWHLEHREKYPPKSGSF